MGKGIIHQIIGPVIDIKFSAEELPELLSAINVEYEIFKDFDVAKLIVFINQHFQ